MHARGETADLVRLAPGRHRWRAARHRTVGGTRQSVEMRWESARSCDPGPPALCEPLPHPVSPS
jgi:hypothetical protein